MKNTVKALLVLPLVLSLAGCGSSEPAKNEETNEETAAAETPKEDSSASGFSPFAAIDTDELTVTVTGVDVESNEPIKLEYENKTADKEFRIRYPYVIIDGFEDHDLDSVMVKPGKTAKDKVYNSYQSVLSAIGLNYTDIELEIEVVDDGTNEVVLEETFHVYPYGEDKAEEFVLKDDMFETVLLDNDTCKISVISDELNDQIGYYTVYAVVENKTDHRIGFDCVQAMINGTESECFSYLTFLEAGSRGITGLAFKVENIESVDEAVFAMRFVDENGMDTGTETLTYKPE